ncbi:MAG TPA: LysR family transcriptional regulator substrate-binding protein, partial [Planctomycetaceae bacterium]|nr:LysR family transcriptional regulator substrate-binding protein [Planctomycetaceae bacterium]
FVGFTQDLTIRREVDRWLKRAKIAVNVVHEFDNIETIKRAIEIGAGAALLPAPTVWQEISLGSLIALPITDVDLIRPLGIVHKRNKQLTTAVQKLIELLQQEAAAAPRVPAAAEPPPVRSNGAESKGRHTNGARRRAAGTAPRRKARARV